MQTAPHKKLILTVMATECGNRCRHCWAQGHPPLAPMKLRDIKMVADQLSTAAHAVGFGQVLVMLMNDIWCHREALDLWRFQRSFNNGIVDKSILTNGHVLAHHPHIGELLADAKAEGIDSARLTIHGLPETHDWFVQRAGAYEDITTAAKRLAQGGVTVEWNIYLSKRNINELAGVVEMLRHLTDNHDPLLNVTIPSWVPNRRLMEYEPLRPDVADLENAGETWAKQTLAPMRLPEFLHEGQVTRAVLADDHDMTEMNREYAKYRRLGSAVSITCDHNFTIYEGPPGNYEYCHGNLLADGAAEVLRSIVDYYPDPLPSIRELAETYGQAESSKLHASDISIVRKWLAALWEAESRRKSVPPGIDPELYALA